MPAYLKHFVEMVANMFEPLTAALFIRSHRGDDLDLVAWETLSSHVVPECTIGLGHGLIGWVAREGKMLHVTHFDRDTRTLGIYSRDVEIKAFLATPLLHGEGVLMVDSRNRYAFPEKKQRILENCAAIASDLLSSWRGQRELEFYRCWHDWHLGLSGGTQDILTDLRELLGLKWGLVAFREGNKDTFVVQNTTGLPQGAIPKTRFFNVDTGLVGWLLKYRKHLILSRFGKDRHRSYFLWPDEPFDRGPVVIGLFQSVEAGALAWILTGNIELSGWPEGLAELLVLSLDKGICRGT